MVSLHAFVLAAAALTGTSELVLLDFGADWCAPCRSMEPTIQRLQEAGFPVRRVNVNQSPDLAQHFSVGPIPCFVLVKDGREIERVVGATSYDRLVQMFHQASQETAGPASAAVRGQSPDQPVRAPIHPAELELPPANMAPADTRQILQPPAPAERMTAPQSDFVQQLALRATVRLRVVDATGQSHGTGTIIDTHGDEALILTCGHIFRESNGRGEILVEMFVPGTKGPIPGHLLSYESEKRDFGLVSFRPDVPVTPVRVASTDCHPRPGDPIFSVGCDHAQAPTVRVSTISAIDRYTGPPNIEILGHPVEGRSGGGLLTAEGRLIGICNAADMQEDRGIFAALPTIHYALTNLGLQQIYLAQTPLPTATLEGAPGRAPTAQSLPVLPVSATSREPATAPHAPAAGDEIICIIRSDADSDGNGRVMIVKNPSPGLLQLLAAESQLRRDRQDLGPLPPERLDTVRLPAASPPSDPIIRAQR